VVIICVLLEHLVAIYVSPM